MNGSTIHVKTGSEGPRHDRYAYEEITITRSDGRRATVHTGGLAEWMDYFNGQTTRRIEEPYTMLSLAFEALMGVSLKTAERIPAQLHERRVRQHRKHDVQWVDGYPGESLLYCSTCGTVLDSHFDRSVIE